MIRSQLLLPSSNEAQRLFHGRGHAYDGLEHINIDWFSPVVLITLYQEVELAWLDELAEHLFQHVSACDTVLVQYRCRAGAPFELLKGETVANVVAVEHQLSYQLNFSNSQNFGFFIDMKNGRHWLQQNAKGKRVLNLFAYTCSFSVAALAGEAEQVVNLDMSKAALARGRDNHRLNQQDLTKVRFEGVDLFKSFGRVRRHGPFDILICDPPAFQKGSVDIKRDYKKIIKRIPEFMDPGSDIMLCLNSPDLDDTFLTDTVAEYCPDCQFIEKIAPPEVFKEAEKGRGLKVQLYNYLP